MGPRYLASEKGQGLVEFALVLPLLLLMVAGIIDLGKAFGYKNDLTHLANSAARQASVNAVPPGSCCTTITAYVMSTAPNELQNGNTTSVPDHPNPTTITYQFTDNTAGNTTHHCKGDPVKVTVSVRYAFGLGIVPGIHLLKTVSSSATMRMENNYDAVVPGNNKFVATGYPGAGDAPSGTCP